jgi:uncharacterized phage protein gp47/JayE
MSTSGYFAPYVDAAGLHVPTYAQILADDIAIFQSIWGTTYYLGIDSPWYQYLSARALKQADTVGGLQLAYNSRSPVTAVGAALDSVVKLNGIARLVASYSTCQATLAGTLNAVVTNGTFTDASGNQWVLPASVTIASGSPAVGSITVTATCMALGPITAVTGAGTPVFPQAGWTGVTIGTSVPGTAYQMDGQLRALQAISTMTPSQTMLAKTVEAIANVSGVTRKQAYENYTSIVDSNGNPPKSVTCVVEGGTDLAVATAIFNNRGIGPLMNGTDQQTIIDPNSGIPCVVGFYRPTYVAIYTVLNVHLLSGSTAATLTSIQSAITNYLNGLQIGEEVTQSALYAAAMAVTPNLSSPIFSIKGIYLGTTALPSTTADIAIAFNAVAQGVTANCTVNSV